MPARGTARFVGLRSADQTTVHDRREPLGSIGARAAPSAQGEQLHVFIRDLDQTIHDLKPLSPASAVERGDKHVDPSRSDSLNHVAELDAKKMGLVDGYESRATLARKERARGVAVARATILRPPPSQ